MDADFNPYEYPEAYRDGFGTLEAAAKHKLSNDNDIKIIVQGTNSQTGIGKTTLAVHMCRRFDLSGSEWQAEEKSFIDVEDYLQAHLDYPKGSALLLDEIEAGADSRRATSSENVELSQGWATLRARNIATVATLPSTSMLDNRMLELADFWVLVKSRGLAQAYEINVNDFKPSGTPSRQPLPNDEHIQFSDLPDGDPDKEYLDTIKDEMVRGMGSELRKIPLSEHKQELQDAREEAKREQRNEAIRSIYADTDLSMSDISKLGFVDVSQQQVSNIANGR